MIYLILILTFFGIVFGADNLVNGAVGIARKFKVSEFVIGAAIVGIGTSMPELVVSFLGALQGNSDVAIGNVIGSNIFNVLGILGLTALIFPIPIKESNLKFEIPFCLGMSIIVTLMIPIINWVDGLILLVFFGIFMWISFVSKPTDMVEEETYQLEPVWKNIMKIVGGLGLLVISCDIFVDKAVLLAKQFGLSDAAISLTLIACGTSLPELAASTVAAFKKNTQLALGNIVGSNIFNIAFILGLSSQVMPLTSSGITVLDYTIMIASAILIMICGFCGKINRLVGLIMLLSFVGYTSYLLNII